MTPNQILRKLRNAGFNSMFIQEVNRDEVEVFNGDATDRDGNRELAHEAARATGLNHIVNIAYGGYLVTANSVQIDSENCL